MSDETSRPETDKPEDEVEAHKFPSTGGATIEPSDEVEDDEVEAHKFPSLGG